MLHLISYLTKVLSFFLCPQTHFSLINKHVKFLPSLPLYSTFTCCTIKALNMLKQDWFPISRNFLPLGLCHIFKDTSNISNCFHMQVKFSASKISILPFPHYMVPSPSVCYHFPLKSTTRLFPWIGRGPSSSPNHLDLSWYAFLLTCQLEWY